MKGFLVLAQNNKEDYVRMASVLAMSLKATQKKHANISIIIEDENQISGRYVQFFDEIFELNDPGGEHWKIGNKWRYFDLTPYEETVVLDADMLFLSDVSDWWEILSQQDFCFTTEVKTFRGETATSDYYRKVFTSNSLPNIYTAFFYFKKNEKSERFFKLVETIFRNWKEFYSRFLQDDVPGFLSGDVAYALALKILGVEDPVFPLSSIPTFVHMKSRLQNAGKMSEDWTKHFDIFFQDGMLMIENYRQYLPFHYFVKSFLTKEIEEFYESSLGLL